MSFLWPLVVYFTRSTVSTFHGRLRTAPYCSYPCTPRGDLIAGIGSRLLPIILISTSHKEERLCYRGAKDLAPIAGATQMKHKQLRLCNQAHNAVSFGSNDRLNNLAEFVRVYAQPFRKGV